MSSTSSTASASVEVTVSEVIWYHRSSSLGVDDVVYLYNTSGGSAKGALQGRAVGSLTSLLHVLQIPSVVINDTGIYTCVASVDVQGTTYNDTDVGYMSVTGAYELILVHTTLRLDNTLVGAS